MKWETLGDSLYIFGPILRAEDVLIKEISEEFYQIRPLIAGAHIVTRDGEQFRVFVFSGTRWIT
jgi:hypothetical protein